MEALHGHYCALLWNRLYGVYLLDRPFTPYYNVGSSRTLNHRSLHWLSNEKSESLMAQANWGGPGMANYTGFICSEYGSPSLLPPTQSAHPAPRLKGFSC